MNRGLFEKSLRENWPVTLGFGVLLCIAQTVISFVLPQVQSTMLTVVLRMPFARTMFSALLGTPVSGDMGSQIIQAVPFVHPLVLLIVFAHETNICTRQPVSEIDRGTIDVLLGLPVSRWQIYFWHSLVWAASGMVLLLIGLCGIRAGCALANSPMAPAPRIAITIFNSYCLYLAIGSLACLVSCASDRRGRAVGAVITIIVASFLVNFLAEFWKPAKNLNFLSVLNYYRPFLILQTGAWPVRDIAVLLTSALVFWTAGAVVFCRRDIRTL